jgi:hypothetical protein
VEGAARHEIRRAQFALRRRLGVQVHQDRAAAGAFAGLDVVEDVADEPRAAQVDVEFGRGTQQHARRRLAAIAGHRQLRHDTFRVVWAVIDTVDPHAVAPEFRRQVRVHAVEVGRAEQTACQAGLVGDHYQPHAGLLKRRQRSADAVVQQQFLGPPWIMARVDQRAVAIQKECLVAHTIRPRRLRLREGFGESFALPCLLPPNFGIRHLTDRGVGAHCASARASWRYTREQLCECTIVPLYSREGWGSATQKKEGRGGSHPPRTPRARSLPGKHEATYVLLSHSARSTSASRI